MRLFQSFILFFTFVFLKAQEGTVPFQHISIEQGLPNNAVTAICEDHKSFIWIGTIDGLCRYNAYEFEKYYNHPDDSFSLSGNYIYCILEDASNRLWIGTRNGLNLYDRDKNRFFRFMHQEGNAKSIINDMIYQMAEDDEGNIWIASYNGFAKMTYCNGVPVFTNYTLPDTVSSKWVIAICRGGKKVWLGTFHGDILTLDVQTQKYTIHKGIEKNKDCKFCNRVRCFMPLPDGDMLIALFAGRGLYRYQKKNSSFAKIDAFNGNIGAGSVNLLLRNKENQIVAGTDNGIYFLNDSLRVIKHIQNLPEDTKSLSSNLILSVCYDSRRGLWVGTQDKGLNYHNAFMWDYEQFAAGGQKIDALFILNNEMLILNSIQNSIRNSIVFNLESLSYSNTGLLIQNVFQDRMYIVQKDGLFTYDMQQRRAIPVEKFKGWNISRVISFGEEIWFRVLEKSFYLYNIRTNTLICYPDSVKKPYPHISMFSTSQINIHQDHSGNYWFYNEYGIYKMVDHDGRLLPYLVKPGNKGSLQSKPLSMIADTLGNFWIATVNMGITYFDTKKNIFISYRSQMPLPAPTILSLCFAGRDRICIVTSKGISFFNIPDKTFYHYGREYGFSSILTGGCVYVKNRYLFLATDNGLCRIDMNTYHTNNNKPHVVFTQFSLFNSPVKVSVSQKSDTFCLSKQISETKEIFLKYDQNIITIEYAALNYYMSSQNQYQYYLEGFEKDWNYAGARRSVTYTNLDPGTYIFKVKASNNDGIWNDVPSELKIIVLPPFWQTWWFRTIVFLLTAASVYIVFRIRLRAIEKQKEILEKQVKERTAQVVTQKEEIQSQAETLKEVNALLEERNEEVVVQAEELTLLNATKDKFFSIIAHDLKNPFQAISGLSDLLLMDYKQYDEAKVKEFITMIRESSNSASSLLQNLLQWARSQTKSIEMNPEFFSLHGVVKDVFELLMPNANEKHLSLQNIIPSETGLYADLNMINTVIRNLVNNAIKYTPEKGTISISATAEDKKVIINVADNGVGMDEATCAKLFCIDTHVSTPGTKGEAGTGLGLIICKDFIEKNKGNIRVESRPGEGTRFIIAMPAAQDIEPGSAPESFQDVAVKTIEIPKQDNARITEEPAAEDAPLLLVVDDDDKIRAGIQNYFAKAYRILSAADGKEGLQKATEECPDIIISDVNMPLMDGFEMCNHIKTDVRTSHIPLILLTANTGETPTIKGFETGADDYVTKPFSLKILDARLKNLLETRRKLREIYSNQFPVSLKNSGLSKIDDAFLEKILIIIENKISDENLDADMMAGEFAMSKPNLYRKVKALTNQSVHEFIKMVRLKKAAELLQKGEVNVSEVAFMVGFADRSYFSTSFKKMFGKSPSEFIS